MEELDRGKGGEKGGGIRGSVRGSWHYLPAGHGRGEEREEREDGGIGERERGKRRRGSVRGSSSED